MKNSLNYTYQRFRSKEGATTKRRMIMISNLIDSTTALEMLAQLRRVLDKTEKAADYLADNQNRKAKAAALYKHVSDTIWGLVG